MPDLLTVSALSSEAERQPRISHRKSNGQTDLQDLGVLSQSHTRLVTGIAGIRS